MIEQLRSALLENGASGGHYLGVNISFKGPAFVEVTYDKDWVEFYNNGKYYLADPVVGWLLVNNGKVRWSEIRWWPDPKGIFKKAKNYNLKYGAIIATSCTGAKSVLSIARSDREFSDEELNRIDTALQDYLHEYEEPVSITDAEVEMLQMLANDYTVTEAAKELGITTSSAKERLSRARKRLGCKNNFRAVALAYRRKLIV